MKTILATGAAALALLSTAAAGTVVIDFEDRARGDLVTTQYADVTFSANGFGAMIFDTDDVTGGDDDLGAPFRNADDEVRAPGNVLIVSEDGDADDPDDRGAGGTIQMAFGEAVTFDAFHVFDIDDTEGFTATFYGAQDQILRQLTNTMVIGDNGFAAFANLGVTDVFRAEFVFTKSGAIDDLTFIRPDAVPAPAAGVLFLTGLAGAAWRRAKAARHA